MLQVEPHIFWQQIQALNARLDRLEQDVRALSADVQRYRESLGLEDLPEPEISDATPPDFGPPGSGAVVIEYVGNEPGLREEAELERELEERLGGE